MNLRKILSAQAVLLVLSAAQLHAGSPVQDLGPVCDSIAAHLSRNSGVKSNVKLLKVLSRGGVVDLYFNRSLSRFPLRGEDIEWTRTRLGTACDSLGIGRVSQIFVQGVKLEELAVPQPGNDGMVPEYIFRTDAPAEDVPFIEAVGRNKAPKGLQGRYIALWQSHGRYYNESEDRWMWQRAPVHRTVEDLYTQSYVLPFLIPMLENAGAFVMSPRETDTCTEETVCDPDSSGASPRNGGRYTEKGTWSDAGAGFADLKESYLLSDTPFSSGSARKAACAGAKATASVRWSPEFGHRWKGTVYISYKSLKESTSGALYKVVHLGGESHFIVDQRRGGGTWIRLGEFEMDGNSYVELCNATPKGRQFRAGCVVTADAVRFGGGMGKVERGGSVSGVPAYCEGAMYNMVWNGIDSTVFSGFDSDYTNDFASRGPWVKYMKNVKGIPFDLSLAFHTDAGVTQVDSTIGTLAIYTLKCEGSRTNSEGLDRMTGRALADMVQSQVVNDIRQGFRQDWTRRHLLDKSYSESRTSDVPAMILELLSHQNFYDMKYGHDPEFRFTVSRATYKGVLKFLSALYGRRYVVQPLPVHNFSATLDGNGKVVLDWNPTEDALEPTAVPSGYLVFTRIDGGAWDKGMKVASNHAEIPVEKGHLYSFRIVAVNEGGMSFPSETLSAGEPENARGRVLVVNAFTRLEAPYFFDSGEYAGFDGREDGGVPLTEELSYIGETYNFHKTEEWETDNDPGFGASYGNFACGKVAGNTFDYPSMHGKAIMDNGYAFCSTSAGAFTDAAGCTIIDIIAGKQKELFSKELIDALTTAEGTGVILSGAKTGLSEKADTTGYAARRFGIKWQSSHACPDGMIGKGMELWHSPNPVSYCVENPDGIRPAGPSAKTFIRYSSTGLGAGVKNDTALGRTVTFGFPLEALKDSSGIKELIAGALDYISGK